VDKQWTDTRAKFRRIAAQVGVRRIASEVPASHTTIYRIIRGDTSQPSHALRAAIERIVDDRTDEHGLQNRAGHGDG
jgi:hypothetical protein